MARGAEAWSTKVVTNLALNGSAHRIVVTGPA
jgi:hypothetical protein